MSPASPPREPSKGDNGVVQTPNETSEIAMTTTTATTTPTKSSPSPSNASEEESNSKESPPLTTLSSLSPSPSPPKRKLPTTATSGTLPPSQQQQQQQLRGKSSTPPPPPPHRTGSTGELSENYFSSASSGGLSPEPTAAAATTTTTTPYGNRKRLTSDEILQNVKPAHQFVQYNQDSDGDGSIVFSYPPGTTPPATYDLPQSFARYGQYGTSSTGTHTHHERGASMDSSGTSGSFIRIPPYQQAQQRAEQRERERREQQQLLLLEEQEQEEKQINNKILPYHQRRKLMLKKQQREQRLKEEEMLQEQDNNNNNNNTGMDDSPQMDNTSTQPPPPQTTSSNYRHQRPVPLDTIGSQPVRRSTPPRFRQSQQQQQTPYNNAANNNGQQAYYNNLPPRSRTNSADRNISVTDQQQQQQQRRGISNATPELVSERYDQTPPDHHYNNNNNNVRNNNRKTPPDQSQQQQYYYQQQQQQQFMDDYISHQDLSPDARHFQRKRESPSHRQQEQRGTSSSQRQQSQQQQQHHQQQSSRSSRKKQLTPEKQSQYDYYFSQQRKYYNHQQRQAQQRRQQQQQYHPNNNNNTISTPPNYAHVRNESMGSVSSLGTADNDTPSGVGATVPSSPSMSEKQQQQKSSFFTDQLGNDIAGYLQEEQDSTPTSQNNNNNNNSGENDPIVPPPPPIEQSNQSKRSASASSSHHHQHSNHSHRRNNSSSGGGGSGFLVGLIQNLSPKQSHSSVQQYHQRNQAFLKKAERERAKKQKLQQKVQQQQQAAGTHHQHTRSGSSSSATSKSPRLNRSPRPPNSRGANRPGLAPIDNDDWNSPTKAPKKLMKAAQAGSRKSATSIDEEDPGGVTAAIRSAELVRESNGRPSHHYYQQQQRQQYSSRGGSRHRIRTSSSGEVSSDISGGSFISSSSSSSSSNDSDDDASTSGGGDARRIRSSVSRNNNNYNQQNKHHHDSRDLYYDDLDERTSLLPPSGISTQEGDRGMDYARRTATSYTDGSNGGGARHSSRYLAEQWGQEPTERWDNREVAVVGRRNKQVERGRRKKKKSDRRRKLSSNTEDSDLSDESYYSNGSTSSTSHDYRRWAKKRAKMFHKERTKLIAQWKEEARAEAELARKEEEARRWHKRFGRWMEQEFTYITDSTLKFLSTAETFICNLPLTIGAVALATVTLGVVWFKFAEENLDSCEPVHFHSSQCTFPEFPGCFYCDTSATMYKVAVNFHFGCSAFAGVLSMAFVAKCLLAGRVVLDEMSSPTMASPAGLLCMTTVCVFAGRGWIGQVLVSAAGVLHLGMVCWFIYMALAYHIMPEPSWFPNTVGVGLTAVKTWLYYPMPGHFLMAISLSLNFFFFPISLIRVYLNNKISAPVCWIQMSAPAISLYALTIMAQPSFEEEHPDVTRFQKVHRMVYLPCMHALFALAVVGFLSSVQSLYARWDSFKKKEFSPAHAAFCFPTLAHANAIQAYRAAVDAFSDIKPGTPLKIALYIYWVVILVGGTISTIWISLKFFYMLPSWTLVDVADEEEPPAPNETTLKDVISTGETLRQPFVSPAVLQANETGALIYIPRGPDGRGRYVRTRRLPALGFEPTMDWSEMNAERDVLLDWVAKNPPRRRKKTLSVPGIDFSYGIGESIGTGNTGVYGLEAGHDRAWSIGGHVDVRDRRNMYDASYY